MSSMSRREIFEFVGLVSIVGSLIFVGAQVSQGQRAGHGSEMIGYLEQVTTLREMLIDNADTWHKACAGDELTPAEKTTAAQLYKAYAEFVFSVAYTAEVGVGRGDDEFLFNRMAAIHSPLPRIRATLRIAQRVGNRRRTID